MARRLRYRRSGGGGGRHSMPWGADKANPARAQSACNAPATLASIVRLSARQLIMAGIHHVRAAARGVPDTSLKHAR